MGMHECNGNMRMQRTHENSVGRQECNGHARMRLVEGNAMRAQEYHGCSRMQQVLEKAIGKRRARSSCTGMSSLPFQTPESRK